MAAVEKIETVCIPRDKYEALVDSLPVLFQGVVRADTEMSRGVAYQVAWWVKAGAGVAALVLVLMLGKKLLKV